ncbi:MAG: 3-isopropylmalate dehydratase small subunit [Xanthobacteraceae bacterium]
MGERFTTLIGAAVPLVRDNIDTDSISPGSRPQAAGAKAEFSEKGTSKLAQELFANWRYDDAGNERPDFVLNQPQYRNAKILISGANFGCGSSRESAVWMLKEWGIRCILAVGFAEIFWNNCFANAVLPVMLPKRTISELAEEAAPGAPKAIFTVDLSANSLTAPSGRVIDISLPEFRRRGLLQGLDELAVTLQDIERVENFLVRARRSRPWAY